MKNYLLGLFRLVILILLIYVFFAVFWFYDVTMDPITLFARFFSTDSINNFYDGGFDQLFMSDKSLFALIPGFHDALIFVPMPPIGPIWLRPLLFGYLIPFTLAILFSSLIIWNFRVIYRSLTMRRRVHKLRQQIDSIQDVQSVVYDKASETPPGEEPPSKFHQLIHS